MRSSTRHRNEEREESTKPLLVSAKRFLAACRAGASVDEMDSLLADVRRDQRIQRDARLVIESLYVYCPDSAAAVDEVSALLARACYLMEIA